MDKKDCLEAKKAFMKNLAFFQPAWVKNEADLRKYVRHILLRLLQAKSREQIYWNALKKEIKKVDSSKEYEFNILDVEVSTLINESDDTFKAWHTEVEIIFSLTDQALDKLME